MLNRSKDLSNLLKINTLQHMNADLNVINNEESTKLVHLRILIYIVFRT